MVLPSRILSSDLCTLKPSAPLSNPLLPASSVPLMDVRGASAVNCPGWTFCPENGLVFAGYQRNGSYFSSAAAAYAPEGVQTAFVKNNGWMQSAIAFPTNGTYALAFWYGPRFYNAVWYTNHVLRIRMDGSLVDTLTVTNIVFSQRQVSLGQMSAGTHTLRIEGSAELPAPGSDPCTLIDDVRVTGTSNAGGAGAVPNDQATLRILAGARMDLDFSGSLSVGALEINGVRYRGGYYGAATHPASFSGTGLVYAKQSGLQMILR